MELMLDGVEFLSRMHISELYVDVNESMRKQNDFTDVHDCLSSIKRLQ